MRHARLGELTVSVVALGCGNFGGVGSAPEFFGQGESEPEAFALLDAAHAHGITLLDTANSYGGGRSEEWLGRWLASRGVREEMVITTKVGNPVGPAPGDRGLSAAHIRGQVEESLRRLGTDRIDLYLTHAPDPATPLEETLGVFNELVLAGKVREYGLSNVDGAEVERAVTIADSGGLRRPVNLQIGHSVLEPAVSSTLDTCVRLGVGVTAYSPLAGGWLARDYRPGEPYPEGSRMTLRPESYRDIERRVADGAVTALREEAGRRGVGLPALALAWAMGEPGLVSVIVGARGVRHLAPVVEALDTGLGVGERERIAGLVHK